MNQSDIKRVIDKIEPDAGMEARLSVKLQQKTRRKFSFRLVTLIAAGLTVIICAGIYFGNFTGLGHGHDTANSGILIPKIEPPKSGAAKDMIALIIYQGRVYTANSKPLTPETAEKLLGEKLGKTKGSITEWSTQDEYAVELASNVGIQDVYSVNGYDKSFRIMTFEKIEGVVYAQLFECLNGITVESGVDIFGKFKIENNIESVKCESFDSWNNGKLEYKVLANLSGLNAFLKALDDSTPYAQDSLPDLWDDQSSDSQKFVYLTLKDGTAVQLRLFKDGYVFYAGTSLFFKVDKASFNSFWGEIY